MSIVDGCNFGTDEREKWTINMNKVMSLWNNSKGLQEMHGPVHSSPDGYLEGAHIVIDNLLRSRVNPLKKFHQDFALTDGETNRLMEEIKTYNRRVTGKSFVNPFMNIIGVPHHVVARDPNAQQFYSGIDRAVAYERTQMEKLRTNTNIASAALLEAYRDVAGAGFFGMKGLMVVKRLKDLEKSMATSATKVDRIRAQVAIEKLLEFGDGKLLNEYRTLIETSPKSEKWAELEKDAHPQILKAARATKAYLKDMSAVMVNSLELLKTNYLNSLGYSGLSDVKYMTDKPAHSFVKKIDAAQKKMRENDAYFPQRVIQDMSVLKQKAEKFNRLRLTREKTIKEADAVAVTLENWGLQKHAKARMDNLQLAYEKDPITVMNTFGYEVIGFNKQQKLKNTYFTLLRKLPKNETRNLTHDYTVSMMKYLDDIYGVATRGYQDRPQWINDLSYTLGATTAIRTMGFGLTGAVRNAASVGFYYSYFGVKQIRRAKKLASHGELLDKINKAEQETGFAFNEGVAARELISQGLLPESGIKPQDISFNEQTGQMEYKSSNGFNKYLAPVLTWGVDKSLIFHRITENHQRRHMFRTAYSIYYDSMINNGNYMAGLKKQYGGAEGAAKNVVESDARNFALNAVNSWAYEYAPHAKSKFIRGVPGERDSQDNPIHSAKIVGGAVSSWFNMLMHYPHSLIATHGRMARGAIAGAKAGQWNAPEQQYIMRYGALYVALQVISALANTDLNNLFENDTLEKMKSLRKSVLDKDKDDVITRGIVGETFGPLPDDLRYAGEKLGLLNADRTDFQEILMGNQNYAKMSGRDEEAAAWYKLSTLTGLMQNKIFPSFADGRGSDIFRHLFKLYPSEETKERSDYFYGKTKVGRKFRRKYGRRKASTKMYDTQEGKMKELASIIQDEKFSKGYEGGLL